jgi:hypothetical protein
VALQLRGIEGLREEWGAFLPLSLGFSTSRGGSCMPGFEGLVTLVVSGFCSTCLPLQFRIQVSLTDLVGTCVA